MGLRKLEVTEMEQVSGGSLEGLWNWLTGGDISSFEAWMRNSVGNTPNDSTHNENMVTYEVWINNQNATFTVSSDVAAQLNSQLRAGAQSSDQNSTPGYSQYDYARQVCGSCHH